ncbi:xylene monooxygenase [bacterium]|nr:xylene monooxygenase [bacterium]NIN92738.1 xylene monooxygenase [bacterium]NIO18719.1 xylene monooxygenase [bacterium]NIO73795.1 xylene monooxygenase [bacterium]
MIDFETEVLDIIQRTYNVKSFRFRTEGGVDFKPGQFFFVTIKIDGVEKTKHFSFSNSPTEKGYVEFTKRITDSEFSQALERLKVRDWARLKMPYGSFTFGGEYEKIVFLSGGIGITPIRSICKFATDSMLPTDMVLLYGNNREEDIIFRQDLDNMKSVNKNLRIVYTLTSADIDRKIWKGKTGYIDDTMIKEEIPDYTERIFYICGPPRMVESLIDILKNRLGIEENRIKRENFVGY